MIDPLSHSKIIFVGAAVIRRSNHLLLTKRPYGSEHGGFWEFPGGKINNGETPASCVKRELKEELDADIFSLDTIFQSDYEYPSKKVKIFFVRAFLKKNSVLRPLEGQDFKWVPICEIRKLKILPADFDFIENFIVRANRKTPLEARWERRRVSSGVLRLALSLD